MAFGVGRLGAAPPRRPHPYPSVSQRVQSSVRVGPNTLASRAAAARAAGGTSAPGAWTPPPLPTGLYNPSRTIEAEESQRGLGQTEGKIKTQTSRDTTDYYDQRAQLERQAGQQQSDYEKAQTMLKQSFQKLGTRQEESANVAGALQSGALLQAAAKRAANEGQQSEQQTTAFHRQQEANQLQRAQLDLIDAPPDAANPLGGRNFQDLLSELTNAQSNNAFFGESQQQLAGQEAAERGYSAPSAPHARPPARPHGANPLSYAALRARRRHF